MVRLHGFILYFRFFLDKQEKTAKLNTNSEGVPNHCGQIGRVYMTCIAFPPTI